MSFYSLPTSRLLGLVGFIDKSDKSFIQHFIVRIDKEIVDQISNIANEYYAGANYKIFSVLKFISSRTWQLFCT